MGTNCLGRDSGGGSSNQSSWDKKVNLGKLEVSRRRKVPTKSGSMLDKIIGSISLLIYMYLRAGELDVIFSVGFRHKLSKKYRFWGCLE